MRRKILIIDDQDDLASALDSAFSATGHKVTIAHSREEALEIDNLTGFDLVITDLDVENVEIPKPTEEKYACLPKIPPVLGHVKAFKFCAANFRRDEFNEDELLNFVETVLNYKIRFVDTEEFVRDLHEKIEFEIPSAITPMQSILDYLMKRVEKVGVIRPEKSNLFVALDEAFVNAVKHGNKFNAQKLVKISAEISSQQARFTIEDEGEGFDMNAIPDPLDPENLFKSSGRGVLFIYNIMDEVQYNERGNQLTMIKKRDTEDRA
ncbi:MAG TPA: hypothetical protein DEA22_13680 [Blastocatellia bacterium]|nr:hypothetical protein [Blastocatellia bacterium]